MTTVVVFYYYYETESVVERGKRREKHIQSIFIVGM